MTRSATTMGGHLRSRKRPYRRPALRVHAHDPDLVRALALRQHRMLPDLLRLVLEDRAQVVGETSRANRALDLCHLLRPHVLVADELVDDGVIDHFLPEFVRAGTDVVVVAQHFDTDRFLAMLECGAAGIVVMDRQAPAELGRAVLDVAAGGCVLPPGLMRLVLSEWRVARRGSGATSGNASGAIGALTGRELEVLAAMCEGLTAKAVARRLGVAVKTVENHKSRIFDKLGVRTQTEAVAAALRMGVLGPDTRGPVQARRGRTPSAVEGRDVGTDSISIRCRPVMETRAEG